ncbi:hypothetical protein MOA67_gp104 [Klebsiella phage KpLz-2_45]|uniref:hypothetical protein n=1 Tax=Klebsiella phage KpLz-2_45 TaxID=2698923 RepID=UPI001F13562C|nr:hypothetical protein MOA67_gp104 [Klebsiella phage KpLz-2_45]UKS71970.1 hypothetical protein KpLz245_1040 [Klebsiella phage KpLz-2_45]
MRLKVSKLSFLKAVEDLAKYRIDTTTFGRRVGETTRATTDITYKRIGSKLIIEYLGMNAREYRCRGFRLSLQLGVPVQVTSLEALKIDITEFYRLFKKLRLDTFKHAFQRYVLWTFLDVYGTRHYVLHLMYATERDPEFYPLTLNEDYASRYPVEGNIEKRSRRFLEWLNFYA